VDKACGKTKYVYDFAEGHRDLKELLGGKGANLAEMTRLGLPVPAGFTVTTEACRAYLATGAVPDGLAAEIAEHLAALEQVMGRRLGDPADPLLVSVRSGAAFSMPGMMETVLNVGLNDDSVEGLAAQAGGNDRFAWDSYRRLIQMFGKTVCDVPGEEFSRALDDAKESKGVTDDLHLDAADLRTLVGTYKSIFAKHTGYEFPHDPREQLQLAMEAVFRSWNADPGRPRYGRQRRRDGLRQPRRRLRHRSGVHPRPGQRRAGHLR
jgi:pyruvate,orthophosphate dikinase